MDKYSILNKYFGYTEFRKGQEEIIDALLNGEDVIAVMPTGSGKSVCYQIPAMMMNGITLVISPLISLMKDQVSNLNQSGIPTCFINSSQNFSEQIVLFDAIKYGEYKIVYIAPERLSTSSFINFCQNIHISMITIDEAHCISQWGQDFRPSYLNICDFIENLPYRPQIGAFTATATNQVKKDISEILKLNNPHITSTGFDRPNLYFSVINSTNKFSDMLKIIKKYKNCSGIIYCGTRKNVDNVTERLLKIGVDAVSYHAGLSEKERRINQDEFIYDHTKIIVATNAFGMGIDKSNVSFIIHYNMPKDIESYYQEAGRAGRDGSNAECYLLYNNSDYKLNLFILKKSFEEGFSTEDVLKQNISKLSKMWKYVNSDYCLRYYMLDYFGDKALNYCGNCSNCNRNYKEYDVTVQAQKILSCIYRIAQRKKYVGKSTFLKILKGDNNEKITSLNLNTISTYGILVDEPKEKIKQLISNLIFMDYIGITDSDKPVLYLKKSAADVIKGNKKIMFKFPEKDSAPFALHNSKDTLSPVSDKKLLNILKEVRYKLAKEEEVPAYAILTDKVLYEMCDLKPENIAEFEKVKGIGKIRAEKYGYAFTNAIKKYNNK